MRRRHPRRLTTPHAPRPTPHHERIDRCPRQTTSHWLRGQFHELHLDIERALAEDDLVFTHSNLHLKPGDRGMAVADIWRIADGRIVEHWDVVQEVSEESANNNTMF